METAPAGTQTVDPRDAALMALAEGARRLVEAVVRTDVDPAEADEVTRTLAALAVRLEGRVDGAFVRVPPAAWAEGRPIRSYNPVIGTCNPLAPPVVIESAEPPVLVGAATLGAAYEGPPGYVHGGVVSMLFDQVLGLVNSLAGQGGMTVSLTVRYRRPTPLHAPLRIEARHLGIDGRKIRSSATITVGGEVTCEAEGLFLALRPEQRQELFGARLGGTSIGPTWS